MSQRDDQDQRIEAIIGHNDQLGFDQAVTRFFEYLKTELQFPCDVTGIEDFRWEEIYVLGPGDPEEYEELKKSQPSYRDHYELLRIERGVTSQWMLFGGEDIAAHVRRKSDGNTFCLGLSELQAVERRPAIISFWMIMRCGLSIIGERSTEHDNRFQGGVIRWQTEQGAGVQPRRSE
jgi:hypothetical protein